MSDFDNRGQVALWKNQSDNERAPVLRGTLIAHRNIREGEEIEVALWKNPSDNERAPVLKGKASDKYEKPAEAKPEPAPETFDDLPF